MNLFPGNIDQYFAYVREANERERRDRELRERAESDLALQCSHRVSLYKTCAQCGVDAAPE
jgi:hypothetical protein